MPQFVTWLHARLEIFFVFANNTSVAAPFVVDSGFTDTLTFPSQVYRKRFCNRQFSLEAL